MIKQTIPYTDIDGKPQVEEFHFRITKAEFIKNAMAEGGEAYLERLNQLVNSPQTNGRELMRTFEMILRDAVGKRVGQNFVKNDEVRDHFMFSGAYDAFFMELIQTPDSGATFMKGILPNDMKGAIEEEMNKRGMTVEGEASSTPAEPTPFPQSLQQAVEANQAPVLETAPPQLAEASKDDEPLWLKESRYPTQKELMAMGQDEMSLATKMKMNKAFG